MRRLSGIAVLTFAIALYAGPAVASTAAPVPSHAAITITTNKGFFSCGCVTSGKGTPASPYVIGPWTIPSPSGGTGGWSVKIDNSKGGITSSFNLFGIQSAYNDANPTDPDIWLVNVHTPTSIASGNGNSPTGSNGTGIGVELDNSSNITLDGLQYNAMNGIGVYLNGSSFVSINNSKLKATGRQAPNGDAIYAVNSSNLQIGTASTCPNNSACNDLTYDQGFGIVLKNTNSVVINRATASAADTGGYVLDGPNTYNVTIQNSSATADGPICETFNGQKVNSGYYTDLQGGLHVINGAHDNTFTNDNFRSSAGFNIGNGGNGFYTDACLGYTNQPFTGQVEAPAGLGNVFNNVCYSPPTNWPGLPPSAPSCPGL